MAVGSSFGRAEVAVDGAQGLRRERDRFRLAGERFSTVAEKAEMGIPGWKWTEGQSSVEGDGCRGRKHDGSRKARPEAAALRFDRRTRERGRPRERTAVRTGEVEREADDVDHRTALGRRKHGVRSMPEQGDFPLSAVAIA